MTKPTIKKCPCGSFPEATTGRCPKCLGGYKVCRRCKLVSCECKGAAK